MEYTTVKGALLSTNCTIGCDYVTLKLIFIQKQTFLTIVLAILLKKQHQNYGFFEILYHAREVKGKKNYFRKYQFLLCTLLLQFLRSFHFFSYRINFIEIVIA